MLAIIANSSCTGSGEYIEIFVHRCVKNSYVKLSCRFPWAYVGCHERMSVAINAWRCHESMLVVMRTCWLSREHVGCHERMLIVSACWLPRACVCSCHGAWVVPLADLVNSAAADQYQQERHQLTRTSCSHWWISCTYVWPFIISINIKKLIFITNNFYCCIIELSFM